MDNKAIVRVDQVGYWSELKFEILEKYAQAYSTIISSQKRPRLHHVYIDGFSGAGTHISRTTGALVKGSPLVALEVEPPFSEYFFIDLDGDKVAALRAAIGDRADVRVLCGDCNEVLRREVLPRVRYKDYRRGLCLLDPYGLHLHWDVIEATGRAETIDLFLNVPMMDMNRNALWRDPAAVASDQAARMTAFWGDETWKEEVYKPARQRSLFGDDQPEKQKNAIVAEAFRRRLRSKGRFANVPEPLAMRNSRGVIVYYLFFASQNAVALKIVQEIFKTYRGRRI